MARLANLYGVNESLPSSIPKVPNIQRALTKSTPRIKCTAKNTDEFAHDRNTPSVLTFFTDNTSNASRRSVIGLASFALFAQFGVKTCLAEEQENDGFPLPGLPPVENKIANEETGTRSFLKKGLYMADIGTKGSAYRLKKYAFDLMAMGDMIGQDVWNYIRRYLRLKGTVMYYDFDKVISAAPVTDKQPLTDLANRLFDNLEKLQYAVKMKDLPLTQSCYQDTTVILQEVMDRMT